MMRCEKCCGDKQHDRLKPWLARAERMGFLEGDVVYHTQGQHGVVTIEKFGPVYDPYGIYWNDNGEECSAAPRLCSLLRPVDWTPHVGDRVVVFQSPGIVGSIIDWSTLNRGPENVAPAELAEPLIPLLRGEPKGYRPEACSSGGGAQFVGGQWLRQCEPLPTCPRCGEVMEGDECGPWCATTEQDKRGIHGLGWAGRNVFGANHTAREIAATEAHNNRWTSTPRQLRHCRKCGRDGGCACGVEYCA